TIIKPGTGMNMHIGSNTYDASNAEDISFVETMLQMIPTNPIASLANGDMLQVIIFAVIVGLLIANLQEKTETLGNIITEVNDLMMSMTMGVMKLAPIGVFCLIARTFASLGYDVILSMISYMATVMG